MKKIIILLIVLFITNIGQAQTELWKLDLDADNHKETVTLTKSGNTYKGTLNDGGSFNATFKLNKFTGYFRYNKKIYKLKGERQQDIVTGTSFYGKYCACSGEPDKIFTLTKLNKIATTNMQGTWDSDFGELRLLQNGTRVYGDYKNVGKIVATMKGNLVSGTFTNGNQSGIFKWILSDKSFTGTWAWKGQPLKPSWNATLKSKAKPTLKNGINKNINSTGIRRSGLSSSETNTTEKSKDFSGRYRITITNIYTRIGKIKGIYNREDNIVDIYGMIGVRLKGKGNSGNVEIKSIGNKNPRLWDFKSSNPIKTKQKQTPFLGGGKVDLLTDPTGVGVIKAGKIEVDKMREFLIKGELANKNLMVNIQCNLKDWNAISNINFGWKQRNLYVKDMLLNKEYLLVINKGNDEIAVGFKLEKI